MYSCKWLSVIFVTALACGKPLPELRGFEAEAWKQDRKGCKGKRTEMKAVLIAERSKLLALSELQVVDLLGKPDQNELYKRNQKFYTYFIDPAEPCGVALADTFESRKKLIVRFNAMGLAKEISIE